ncbi:MAG: hypothetical protein H6741_04045 [Alphaproteobacteria bacterium]|nr:hypothetical protein [Alphaproteobacteria bacterium]MCB9791877.1 hypothetical protein [Alphaproteobacteria bacterium]
MAKRKRSAGLALEQVAQGIGLDVSEVRARLRRSGAEALLGPDGRVPLEALDAIVAKVKAAAASAGIGQGLLSDAAGIEALMERSGVQRLQRAPAKPKRSAAPPAPKAQAAPPSASPQAESPQLAAPVAPAAPPLTAPPRAVAPRPSVIRGDLLAAPSSGARRLDVLQEQLAEAERQRQRVERELSAVQTREVEHLRALEDARAELCATRAHVEVLERRSAQEAAPAPAPEPAPAPPESIGSLSEMLLARGLKGEDEAASAVRALMQARRWEQVAGQLTPEHPESLRALLQDRLLLHCGRESCATPPGSVPVHVAASRCECCGGGDLARSLRRLGETLLLNGMRRVSLVGVSPAWARVITEQLDARVELVLLQGAPSAECQLLLAWHAPLPAELPEGLQALHSEAPSLAGFADEVTGELQRC